MLDRTISYSFYLLFFLTPLFWSSQNYELFEFNKMILTYAFTVVIVGCWLLKSINDKRLTIKRTPLDIPLLLFLGANILSTIFSMDVHTSIWGYYSRSNGGLLSLVSYLLLYWAFVSNMDKAKILKTLKFGLISGFIISLWGIFEHFGVSPSCVILRGEFSDSCWIQDVQARVFATLGQPNWMAVYLSMLIFPAIYFFLTATPKKLRATYYLLLTTYYLAFTFTYSRGPTLGLLAGIIVLIAGFTLCHPEGVKRPKDIFFASLRMTGLGGILISFLAINIFFGSALTSFRLISKFAPPPRPSISLPSSTSQLETGGTESGQIRFIVWQGALDIFKHNPIFGSGLETFAYSYYQFRPEAHNFTSEWDFLYNKAHNEYLNYLATTGMVGFGTYMLVIIWFMVYTLWFIVKRRPYTINHLLLTSLLAAYISYLVYNFFLFSVVIIAVFFYLFPAMAFVATDALSIYQIPSTIYQFIYRRTIYTRAVKAIIILSILYLLYSIFKLWYADTIFAKGEKAVDSGNPGRAYNLLSQAVYLNPGEPFYRSEVAFSAAQSATALKDEDATLSAALKDEASVQMAQVLKESPKNISYLRSAIRTYFELSTLDKSFGQKTLDAVALAITLAPTDPKLYYNQALILDALGKKDESVQALKKALQLKPDYQDAKNQLTEATASGKK